LEKEWSDKALKNMVEYKPHDFNEEKKYWNKPRKASVARLKFIMAYSGEERVCVSCFFLWGHALRFEL